MKKFIPFLIFVLFIIPAKSQDTTGSYKPKIFRATVYANDTILSKDFIVQVRDSTISLSKNPNPFNRPLAGDSLLLINYSQIEYIKIQRKGSVGRGVLYGFISGLGAGLLIGLAEGDDEPDQWFSYTAGEKAVIYGLTLGVAGGIIGAVIGAVAKKKFYINRTPSKLQELNISLLERVYSK